MNEIEWPSGYKFGAWFSHDIDRVKKTYQCVHKFLKERRPYHLRSFFFKKNPYWTFDEIMNIEKDNDIKSTFFFLNETIKLNPFDTSSYKLALGRYNINDKRIVQMIKKLDNSGWEIGIHGSYNSYSDIDLLRKEKDILEKIIDNKVVGIRQHYLNLNIPTTWRIQRDVGLKYDSSFGMKEKVGFRDDKIYPFRPFNDHFVVFPLNIWDQPLFLKKWDKDSVLKQSFRVIDLACKKGSVITILFHNDHFNNDEYPGQIMIYEKIIKYLNEKEAYIGTGKQIYGILKGEKNE